MAEVVSVMSLIALLLPVPAAPPDTASAGSEPALRITRVAWFSPAAPQNDDEGDLLLPALAAPGLAPRSAVHQPTRMPTSAALALDRGNVQAPADVFDEMGPFWFGHTFLETNVGAYFSQRGLGPATPRFDFLPINFRLGMVLNDPCFPGVLRGSYEGLVEFSTAPVVGSFGHIVVGPTGLVRYNWVQPNCRLVPYLQGGAGFAYTDAYRDREQHAIGEGFEFTLKAAAGLHYLVNDHVSVDVEGGYTHISNADLASRNLGINALGGSLGITFYFPCGR